MVGTGSLNLLMILSKPDLHHVSPRRPCLVCPSVKEGWGITIIEANALGVPVVATDAPGLRDAVRDGETGVLVADGPAADFSARLADAIRALLADSDRLSRLSAEAAVWARRFDWDTSARKMAETLEAACRTG